MNPMITIIKVTDAVSPTGDVSYAFLDAFEAAIFAHEAAQAGRKVLERSHMPLHVAETALEDMQ
jgi:hypothetical protein